MTSHTKYCFHFSILISTQDNSTVPGRALNKAKDIFDLKVSVVSQALQFMVELAIVTSKHIDESMLTYFFIQTSI